MSDFSQAHYSSDGFFLDHALVWLQCAGIDQEVSLFCLALMSMIAIKGYLLQRLKWDSVSNCFSWTALTTLISLGWGAQYFGLSHLDGVHTLVTLGAASSLVEGLVMLWLKKSHGMLRIWGNAIGINLAAMVWLAFLNLPSLFCPVSFAILMDR